MSKRHQASRRKAYGRRQHEVRERFDQRGRSDGGDFGFDDFGATASGDPFAFLDPRAPRIQFALRD